VALGEGPGGRVLPRAGPDRVRSAAGRSTVKSARYGRAAGKTRDLGAAWCAWRPRRRGGGCCGDGQCGGLADPGRGAVLVKAHAADAAHRVVPAYRA